MSCRYRASRLSGLTCPDASRGSCQTNLHSSPFGQRRYRLCRAEIAPLGAGGGAVLLELSSAREAAFLIENVEDGGVDGGETAASPVLVFERAGANSRPCCSASGQLDDLTARFEVLERVAFFDASRVGCLHVILKPGSFDKNPSFIHEIPRARHRYAGPVRARRPAGESRHCSARRVPASAPVPSGCPPRQSGSADAAPDPPSC